MNQFNPCYGMAHMTGLIEIPFMGGRFTTAYEDKNTLFNMKLERDNRVWSSANASCNTVKGWFDAFYLVERVEIDVLSSDQTSWGCLWEVQVDDGGMLFPVENGVHSNVGRGGKSDKLQFSLDNDPVKYPLKEGWIAERLSMLPLRCDLGNEPANAMGLEIRIEGHGWFWIQGLSVWGTKRRDYDPHERATYMAFITRGDEPHWVA